MSAGAISDGTPTVTLDFAPPQFVRALMPDDEMDAYLADLIEFLS